jgi:hypothetical protein
MKILISVKDRAEAEAVLDTGGVDFLDIKNPEEGTLGASKPWIIEEISEIPHGKTKIAASIGDLDYRPGSAAPLWPHMVLRLLALTTLQPPCSKSEQPTKLGKCHPSFIGPWKSLIQGL